MSSGSERVSAHCSHTFLKGNGRTVDPNLKAMSSPVGGGPEGELTDALRVMDCPTTEGLAEETSVVVVAIEGELPCSLRIERRLGRPAPEGQVFDRD